MEQLSLFVEAKRKEKKDVNDNYWFINQNTVYLKLAKEPFNRKLGIIHQDRFIVYRDREKHLFKKDSSYGFNAEVISELYKFGGVRFVDVYDNFGCYRITIDIIKKSGYLHFKSEGFELQQFVPVAILEQFKVELPEDVLRRNLLGSSWYHQLKAEFHKPYWNTLGVAVAKERELFTIYPEREDVFNAFKYTTYENLRVVIINQEPYHNGTADGLAFSSKESMRLPPALQKIYDTLEQEIHFGLFLNQNNSLSYLAEQGVLLLNTALTVREGEPKSHLKIGWSFFISRVFETLKYHPKELVIMLWGERAQYCEPLLASEKHLILKAEHPNKAVIENRDWENGECFKKANKFLSQKGHGEIRW